MAWELLKTDYEDAAWSGYRKFTEIENEDGTLSFVDVTVYTTKENSFFGAKDANAMNEAINYIMEMLENGTDLYEGFTQYFAEQKVLFENSANEVVQDVTDSSDARFAEFVAYLLGLQEQYEKDMSDFEGEQQTEFTDWFESMKDQLSEDAAGKLQSEVDDLTGEVFERYYGMLATKTEFLSDGSIVATNDESTVTTTFSTSESGETVVTETVVPTEGTYNYVKTTVIGTSEITESYEKVLK